MIILMVAVIIIFLGLVFGSFVNALVWRLRQQLDDDGNPKKLSPKKQKDLSVLTGRSMCPHCKHQLATRDLVPIISWITLKGKCRYCSEPISAEYPIVEGLTAVLFAISYFMWPFELVGVEWVVFIGYLVAVVFLIALAIYDLKWFILPSKLIYIPTLIYISCLLIYGVITKDFYNFGMAFVSGLIFFGLFLSIYILSALAKKTGKSSKDWLGFGDVRLAFLLGLLVGQPILVFVAMFLASILGIIIILPSLLQKKLSVTSQIPFGPFLITGAIITVLFGERIVNWYISLIFGV